QDQNVGVQSFEISCCVFKRLAFGQARGGYRNIDHVCAEAMRCQFERSSRARARLDEKVDHGFAAKWWNFFDLAGADLFEGICGFEIEVNFLRGKLAQPEQMFAVPIRAHSLYIQTASCSWSPSAT